MPTVETKFEQLSFIIYSNEKRYFAVIDIPNNFIHTRINNETDMDIIKIHRILVDVILYIAPYVYGPYLTMDKKVIKQQITQCIDTIYVTIVTSIFYYLKFCNTLKLNKLNMNPYDPCVSNLLVNGLKKYL